MLTGAPYHEPQTAFYGLFLLMGAKEDIKQQCMHNEEVEVAGPQT